MFSEAPIGAQPFGASHLQRQREAEARR